LLERWFNADVGPGKTKARHCVGTPVTMLAAMLAALILTGSLPQTTTEFEAVAAKSWSEIPTMHEVVSKLRSQILIQVERYTTVN